MNNYLYAFYTDNLHYEKFPDSSVKCIEDEIPFELPAGWSWARVFSITEELPYGTAKKSSPTGLVAVLRMGNIQSGEIDYSDLVYSSDRDDIVKYTLIKNDLLFNRTNSAEWVGKTAIYRGNMPAIYAGYLIRIRTFINAEYLNVVMNSGYAKSYCNSVKTDGVNQSNINAQKLGNFLVPIPSFGEQHRISSNIADILPRISIIQDEKDYITDLIQKTKSKILDLAIRGKLVPQNPDDEPASVLLDRIRAEKEELINQGKIKRDKKESAIFRGEDNSYYEKFSDGKCRSIEDELPFELPDGWEWCNLSMIGTTNIGLTYRPTDIDPTGTMVLRSNNIVDDEIDLNDLVRVKTKIRENQYVQPNDILICARNGSKALVGKCALIDELKEPASFGAFMAVYKTDYYKYVLHYLRSSQFRNVFDDGNSTAINQLTQDMLKRALIPFPPISEQERIVNRISELLSRLRDIEKSLS